MIRNILSVTVGLIVGFVVIILVEGVGHSMYLPEAGLDPTNAESLRTYLMNAPTPVFLIIVLGYTLGSFFGGIVASAIANTKRISKAMTVGGILMGLGTNNLFENPHPVWVIICSIVVFLPLAYFGGWVGIKISPKEEPKND